jgi:hypothetical protein
MQSAWLPNVQRTKEPPPCFGKSWERNDPACAGGTDPAFEDENGGHVRERCGYFDTCGARVQAGRMEAAKNLIPATSLARPWIRPPGNPQPSSPAPMQTTQNFAMQQLLQQLQAAMVKQGGAPPQIPSSFGYQQMMPVNFSIPQYLTVREDRKPGESIFGMLGRELFRSVGKSLGHTLGNFFDTTPLFWREPPEK